MNRLSLFVALVAAVFLLDGCRKNGSCETMAFNQVSYVDKFPKSFSLEDGRLLNLGLIGVQSLSVQDSILIVSTLDDNGFWSFFHLPTHTFLGKYLHKGRSDVELIASPRVSNQYFCRREGKLYSLIYDFYTGKLSELNISRTLAEKRPVIRKKDVKIEANLYNFVCLDSTKFFCKAMNPSYTELSRYISDASGKFIPENMEILNESSIDYGSDINILGTYCRYNPTRNVIVEAAMDLSVINLYSVENGMRLSLCPESSLDRISDVQEVEMRKKKTAYCHLESYDDFFAALYYGDTIANIHYGRAKEQRIQFYGWDGTPLAEVMLDNPANSFDIDFHRSILYTLNYETDEIHTYDICDILDYLLGRG